MGSGRVVTSVIRHDDWIEVLLVNGETEFYPADWARVMFPEIEDIVGHDLDMVKDAVLAA